MFLFTNDASMYANVALLITLIVNENERITICHESLRDCVIIENVHWNCDCGFLIGSDSTYQHTNKDR